ncbi:NAD(P)H-hydrate dehydratase [Roseobacter denitrificans]|uniref:NAD(P)H-hydrate dehydratase n=1 Tax=Roseobacter denitrificans TaxID=2434 RepID=UPI00030796AE|nr:NAD(P)H-hydrate dehydratase [Roseobacter denitrificans]AVL51639.1 NAD(P)H-hydrate dehydratase [Roseobacter denitrificans]SFF77711.1 yjeF C-terminal region, hydroxyethylthiazole kinase-related [Roseobacter denitrificans OCh 114]
MAINTINESNLPLELLQKQQGHKFDHGHALVLSGGAGKTGAARLAAMAALRIGAGVVSLGTPPAAMLEVATHISALMVRKIATPHDVQTALSDKRISAICVGPGFGTASAQAALIKEVLTSKRPTVLDADALTVLAANPDLRGLLHPACVLTPHAGEFARLFGGGCGDASVDERAETTVRAARNVGCTLVSKGENTLIADQGEQVFLHQASGARAAPWLATAGSGDVLAGFIAGLLARGVTPMAAAKIAVWLHVECAITFGPGLIAQDLPEVLPRVLQQLFVHRE